MALDRQHRPDRPAEHRGRAWRFRSSPSGRRCSPSDTAMALLPMAALPAGAEFVIALVAARPRALRRARAAAPRALAVASPSRAPQRSAVRLHDGAALPSGRAARSPSRLHLAVIVALGASPLAVLAFESVAIVMGLFTHGNVRVPQALDRALRVVHRDARPASRSPLGVRRPRPAATSARSSRGGIGCSAPTRRSPRTGTSAWPSAWPTSPRTRPRASPGSSPRRSCRRGPSRAPSPD